MARGTGLFDGFRFFGIDGLILISSLVVIGATVRLRDRLEPQTVDQGPASGQSTDSQAAVAAPRARTVDRGWLTVAAIVWIVGGTAVLASRSASAPIAIGVALLLAGSVALAIGANPGALFPAPPAVQPAESWRTVLLPVAAGWLRWVMVLMPAVSCALVWRMTRARPIGDQHTDIVALWLLSMASAIVAVAWPLKRPDVAVMRGAIRRERWPLAALAIITAVAAGLRLWNLDSYPWTMSGDDGSFAMESVRVLRGVIRDPFATGWFAHPTLYFYLEAASMRLFGESIAAVRGVAAILGIGSVVVCYVLVRRLFGPPAGLIAAALVATFHFHIYWSRSALNNIGDAFFAPLTLLLLDQALAQKRRLPALLAGMSIGLAQYFYPGSRMLFPIAALVVGFAVARSAGWSPSRLVSSVQAIIPYVALIVAGVAISIAPLAAYALDHWVDFQARTNNVSVFASGWLDAEQQRTGKSAASLIWHQISTAMILPWHGAAFGFYRPDPPFSGWMLFPLTFGTAIVIGGFWRRRFAGLAISSVVFAVGVGLTSGPPMTNRFIALTWLIPVGAAIGLDGVRRMVQARLALLRWPLVLATAATVLALGLWSTHFFFRDPNQIALYSDPNTQVANTLAYEVKALGPGVTTYFAGPPRMWYDGFNNLLFIAPNGKGINVNDPWSAASLKPALDGLTLFVFLPERASEMQIVQRWFPDGEMRQIHGTDGALLYIEYRVDPGQTLVEDIPAVPAPVASPPVVNEEDTNG